MFEAVASSGANIEMITTSEVRISVLIPAERAEDALRAVHKAFGLDRDVAVAVESESLVNRTQRVLGPLGGDKHANAHLAGGDHLDVGAATGHGLEHRRGDPGGRTDGDAHDA